MLPVDVAGAQLADRCVAAIGHADSATDAKSALGHVQSVAHRPTNAVVFPPSDVAQIDAAGQHQVFDQAPDRVIGQGRHDRAAQAEAAPQGARDVVFATALPGAKVARGVDPFCARIEPEHDLTEGDKVPPG